jgi:hypothetical protein
MSQPLFVESSRDAQEPQHPKVSFTVAIASARRPGNINYVYSCVLSNYCAFADVGDPSTWPSVALVNTEIPPGKHLSELAQTPRVQHYLRNGLTLVKREDLPAPLHEPMFVLELVRRGRMTQQVSQQQNNQLCVAA